MLTSLPQLFEFVANKHSANCAIASGSDQISYGELLRTVRSAGGKLRQLGMQPGDRVALIGKNTVDFAIGYLAICWAGGTIVPLNHQLKSDELNDVFSRAGVSMVLVSGDAQDACTGTDVCAAGEIRLINLEEFFSGATGPESDRAVGRPEQVLMLQLSSGTTGKSKIIARTHGQLTVELSSLQERLQISSTDRIIGVAPFSHVNGLVRSMLNSLTAGATLFPVSEFNRRHVGHFIEENRITIFIGVPFMFSVLADTHWNTPPDFSSLRWCISSSAPLKRHYVKTFQEKYGHFVRQLYGSTETGTISVNVEDDLELTCESIGRPLRGVKIHVIGDDGRAVAPDKTGELIVSSQHKADRYFDADPESQLSFKGPWFYTGDIGYADDGARFYISGRKKFFINKGGFKIDPAEVERLIEKHQAVKEAVVIGIPTSYGDELVKAFVVTTDICSEASIIEFCRGKIAEFKIPSLVEFKHELPKGPTGKILRLRLLEGVPDGNR